MQSWHESGAGGLVAASVYSPDEQVGERLAYSYGPFATGTTVYAYHDQLGSVRRWRLANKNNWGANEYQAFGKAYSVSTLAPQDYALHEWDANLAMFRAPYRNYSPAMARWTTEDPLGMVDGPNMYGYVGEKPILLRDPDGQSILGDMLKSLLCKLFPGLSMCKHDGSIPTQCENALKTAIDGCACATGVDPIFGPLGPIIEVGTNPDVAKCIINTQKYSNRITALCDDPNGPIRY